MDSEGTSVHKGGRTLAEAAVVDEGRALSERRLPWTLKKTAATAHLQGKEAASSGAGGMETDMAA